MIPRNKIGPSGAAGGPMGADGFVVSHPFAKCANGWGTHRSEAGLRVGPTGLWAGHPPIFVFSLWENLGPQPHAITFYLFL